MLTVLVDPAALGGSEEVRARGAGVRRLMLASPPREGFDSAPGRRTRRRRDARRAPAGVPVDEETWRQILAAAVARHRRSRRWRAWPVRPEIARIRRRARPTIRPRPGALRRPPGACLRCAARLGRRCPCRHDPIRGPPQLQPRSPDPAGGEDRGPSPTTSPSATMTADAQPPTAPPPPPPKLSGLEAADDRRAVAVRQHRRAHQRHGFEGVRAG